MSFVRLFVLATRDLRSRPGRAGPMTPRRIVRNPSELHVLHTLHVESSFAKLLFEPSFLRARSYFPGCNSSFCARQFSSSPTYSSFSDGHAISCTHPNS